MRNSRWLQRWLAAVLVALLIGAGLLPRTAAAAPAQVPPRQDQYETFVPISDSAGIFTVEVPEEWQDVEETEWSMDDEAVGIQLTATPDLAKFYDSWDTPGLVLSYSESLPETMTEDELLDTIDYSEVCTDGGRETLPADDGDLSGSYQIWNDCDGSTNALIAVLTPIDSPDYYVMMEIYAVTDADKDAFNHIVDTFAVGPATQGDTGDSDTNMAASGPVTSTESALFDEVDTSDLTYSYVELRDATVVALIPADYGDIVSAEWNSKEGDRLGTTLTAAPNIEDFNSSWSAPGIIVKSAIDIGETLDADELLKDEALEKDCTYDDRYTDERTVGDVTYLIDYDWYNNCGDTESSYVVALAQSDPPDEAIFFDFLIADKADEEAFDVFLKSFSLDRELAAASDAAAAEAATTEENGTTEDNPPAVPMIDVADDNDVITLRVPETWTDSSTEDWTTEEDGVVGTVFTVAPDLEDFANNWDVPGATVSVSDKFAELIAPEDALDDTLYAEECTYDDRYDLETDNLVGQYDVWLDCGDVKGSQLIVLAANPAGETTPLILLETVLPTEEDAAVFGELIGSLAVAGALESAQSTEEETLLDAPLAVVETASLNIRSGPGTNYNRVGVANKGDALVINGQVDDCDWLQVTTPDGVEGWASGKSQYVTLDTRCVDIPEAERPEPPAASASGATEQGGARGDSGSNAGAASNAGSAASSGSANASKGCYLFQNQLGAELNLTFTNRDSGKATTFKVPASGEKEQCFDPGRYTYTLDAPPPWGSTNGELTVQAGDMFLFPITPQ